MIKHTISFDESDYDEVISVLQRMKGVETNIISEKEAENLTNKTLNDINWDKVLPPNHWQNHTKLRHIKVIKFLYKEKDKGAVWGATSLHRSLGGDDLVKYQSFRLGLQGLVADKILVQQQSDYLLHPDITNSIDKELIK